MELIYINGISPMDYSNYSNGDMVAEWIACGALHVHIMGLSLSAASWLTT